MSSSVSEPSRTADLRLGIGSYTYGWAVGTSGIRPARPMSAFDLVEAAAAFGVQVVQIADNLPLHLLPAADRSELRRTADASGIQVEVGTRGIAPEHLRRYLAIAGEFGSSILRLVIDTAEHHPGEKEIIGTLQPLMPEFERAGVQLAIENHDRFPARALERLMRGIDSPAIGICLDTANSLGAQEGVREVAETLAPWVVNLHLKDVSIRRLPHLMGFHIQGAPAGEGVVDFPWLLDFVRTHVPRPLSAIVELWPPPEPRLEETLAKEAAWAASSVRYQRELIPG